MPEAGRCENRVSAPRRPGSWRLTTAGPRGTIDRSWLGKTSRYNDVANWAYADLPKAFRPDTTARSFTVRTVADLEEALSAPNDTLIFIEAIMDPFDAPTAVINGGNNGADLDYGPRGPQHRDNMLIRPAE